MSTEFKYRERDVNNVSHCDMQICNTCALLFYNFIDPKFKASPRSPQNEIQNSTE